MPEADDVLISRSRRGDRQAFEEIVRRTARLVFARAYLETGRADRAEDLTQETFLLAWKRIAQVKDPTTFRPWLMSILHHVVVDAARRESAQKRGGALPGSRVELGRVVDAVSGPSDQVEQREQRERALTVLRSLPQEYREVLMLRYLAGADHETIGRQLAISNGSLRGLLNRGLTMLREELNR